MSLGTHVSENHENLAQLIHDPKESNLQFRSVVTLVTAVEHQIIFTHI
jgi:hypothetical protein